MSGVAPCYTAFGEGEKRPPLLLVGALGEWVWRTTVESLKKRYRIVQVELPGFEKGAPLPSTAALSIDSLGELLDTIVHREKLDRVLVVGWSFGVQAAIAFAKQTETNIAGMVIVCGVAGRPFDTTGARVGALAVPPLTRAVPRAVDWLAAHASRVDLLRQFLTGLKNPALWAKRFGLIDPFTDEALFNGMMSGFLAVDPAVYNRYTKIMSEHDDTAVLASFAFPVLVVAGEKDVLMPPERMRSLCENIKDCEYFEIIGGTHYLPVEYGDLLALKIDAFVKDRCRK